MNTFARLLVAAVVLAPCFLRAENAAPDPKTSGACAECKTPGSRATLFLKVANVTAATPEKTAKPGPARPPNLILILVDDMGYGDVSPFNPNTRNRTPNLERMAREGMKLTSFYACPVCTPSRAQFLTGCYAKRVGLPLVIFPGAATGLSEREHTVAQLLKKQGYATMAIGKWHVGDQPEFLPTRRGFDRYFGLPYSNDMGGEIVPGQRLPPPEPSDLGLVKFQGRPPLPLVRDDKVIETVSPAQQDFLTERYTDEAVKFIREKKDEPFFLYFAHTAVHVPLHPGEKFKGKSANGTYGDWVEEVDASAGRVLDTLRELGLEKNTLVLFTSDNGPWLIMGNNGGEAGPLRNGKGSTWEGGMREPTIAWWPGRVAAGSACDAVCGNIDVLPTFVKLAGGEIPAGNKIDGADIAPLLFGASTRSPREAQFYFLGSKLEAVRSGPWKLRLAGAIETMYGKRKTEAPMPTPAKAAMLFNLDEDIGEKTDVAAQHPDIVKRLETFAQKMDADLGNGAQRGPGVREPGRVEKPKVLVLEPK
jgi:arylsulfatase A